MSNVDALSASVTHVPLLLTFPSTASTPAYNEWRSQTCLFLQKAEGELRDALDVATEERKCQLIDEISDTLSALTKTELNDAQLTSLRKVVEHAVSLSRLFGIQRAEYTCVLPDCSTRSTLAFDQGLMDDMFDAENTNDSSVRCVTFPAVLKASDERGAAQERSVIVKAKVLCQVRESDDEDVC